MSKTSLNIKRHTDKSVDLAEIDEPGMLTCAATALAHDLMPGEQIIGDYRCDTPKDTSWCNWVTVLLTILTCGVYLALLLIWRLCCCCCRPRHFHSKQHRMAVTDMGRLILWSTNQCGQEDARCSCRCIMFCMCVLFCRGVCAPDRKYEVTTTLSYHNARDVVAVMHEHEREPVDVFRPRVKLSTGLKWTLGTLGLWVVYRFILLCYRIASWCCCNKGNYISCLNIYFNEWPEQDLVESTSCLPSFMRVERPHYVRDGMDTTWRNNAFLRVVKGGWYVFRSRLPACCWCSPRRQNDDSRGPAFDDLPSIRIYAATRDKGPDGAPMNSETAFNYLHAIHAQVLQATLPTHGPTFVRQPKQAWVNPFAIMPGASCHLREQGVMNTKTVQIGTGTVALLPGENILNAQGVASLWTCTDWLLSIMTLGLYYCVTHAKKMQEMGALVITDKRIVEVYVCSRRSDRSKSNGPWQQVVRSYIFNSPVTCGAIRRHSRQVTAAVSTKTGSLAFDLRTTSPSCCWFLSCCCPPLPASNDPARIVSFAQTLTLHASERLPLDAYALPVPRDLSSILPIYTPDESVLYYLKNDRPLLPCCQRIWTSLVKGLTCGLRPIDQIYELALTTERAYFVHRLSNQPCSCLACLQQQESFVFGWVNHKEVSGYQLAGKVTGSDTCCKRFLSCLHLLPPCCSTYRSSLSLRVAFGNMFTVFFVKNVESEDGDDFGFMRTEPVLRLRALLSALELSRTTGKAPSATITVPAYTMSSTLGIGISTTASASASPLVAYPPQEAVGASNYVQVIPQLILTPQGQESSCPSKLV